MLMAKAQARAAAAPLSLLLLVLGAKLLDVLLHIGAHLGRGDDTDEDVRVVVLPPGGDRVVIR